MTVASEFVHCIRCLVEISILQGLIYCIKYSVSFL